MSSATDAAPAFADLQLPPGFVPVTAADAPALCALANAFERRLTGEVTESLHDIQTDLQHPGSHHWWLPDADGQAVVWVAAFGGPGREHTFCHLAYDDGIDDAVGHAAIQFALSVARRLDPDKDTHVGALDADLRTTAWLVAAGGEPVRRFGRMDIDLDPADPPGSPALPADVTVRTVEDTDDDWRILHRVIDSAFADHYGHIESTFEEFVAEDRPWVDDYSLCWIASVDGNPAAALLGKQRPGDGYIGVLGTLRDYRGRGLGRLLLRISFAEFARRGQTRASLNVDLTNPTGAVHVYTSVGMRHVQTWVAHQFPRARSLEGATP